MKIPEEPTGPGPYHLALPPDLAELAGARAWLMLAAQRAGLSEERIFDFQVAASEAMANAIEHASSNVDIWVWPFPDRLIVDIENNGPFQPGVHRREEFRRRGLGLPLMVSLADQVHVTRLPAGTTVSLTFFLDSIGGRGPTADEELRRQHGELMVLHEKLERNSAFNSALNSLNARISATLDLHEILRSVLFEGMKALGVQRALLQVQEDGAWVTHEVAGLEDDVKERVLPPGKPSLASLAANWQTAAIVRADTETSEHEVYRAILERYGMACALVVPLALRGEVLGATIFGHESDSRYFDSAHVEFGRSFASAAALALENSRLFTEARGREQERELEARLSTSLTDLAALATTRLEEDHILRTTLAEAIDVAGADRAAIFSPEGRTWRARYTSGRPEAGEYPPLAPDLIDELRRTRRPFWDARGTRTGRPDSALVIPLLLGSDLLWVLELRFPDTASLGRPYEDWARRLSLTMSLALQNAHLYRDQQALSLQLQEALLTGPREYPGLSIGHIYESATVTAEVGGDFYDFFTLSEGRVAVVLGDVSGKGVAAAGLAALLKNGLRAFLSDQEDVATAMQKLNRLMIKDAPVSRFATVFCGALDPGTGELTYVSGGHPPGMLRRNGDGRVELLPGTSPVIGMFHDACYEGRTLRLGVGDLLLLYTDGIMEARRGAELFGEERIALFASEARESPAELPRRLLEEVMTYAGGEVKDDMAIISIRREPVGAGRKGDERGRK